MLSQFYLETIEAEGGGMVSVCGGVGSNCTNTHQSKRMSCLGTYHVMLIGRTLEE